MKVTNNWFMYFDAGKRMTYNKVFTAKNNVETTVDSQQLTTVDSQQLTTVDSQQLTTVGSQQLTTVGSQQLTAAAQCVFFLFPIIQSCAALRAVMKDLVRKV
jgi:hypothetical protein